MGRSADYVWTTETIFQANLFLDFVSENLLMVVKLTKFALVKVNLNVLNVVCEYIHDGPIQIYDKPRNSSCRELNTKYTPIL